MKIGVIGCGNLGTSLLKGLLKAGFKGENIIASDLDERKLEELQKLGIEVTKDNNKTASDSDVIFLAVKPDIVGDVLEKAEIPKDKLLVSAAAGVSTDFLEDHTNARTIRIMPNICVGVAEMASCFTLGKRATEKDEEFVKSLLESLGTTFKVEEKLMNAVTGLSGSGPAYVYLVVEGLKEAGKELGLSEETALKLAAQTVKGSGEMVLNSGKDLKELIDMVCSPKGTTIEGIKVLKDRKVSEAFKKAVKAATKRSEELSK
ncbi:hypothetical protein AKJ58_00455 [candidate division MSBL1 archaeon SCGC-AAA385D11]|uniref:Pyrroline-5-carboxylate reductase n=1 Tax=candidate division MSBL1 archaeon SCGC-AAA385D11 TaxID=1698286 RepID=A0A133VPA5_9EURY|nr:hypothetical protein AKJ58_00455 [candidate division MSBL1 archaeon SCGC-AAA385D11]